MFPSPEADTPPPCTQWRKLRRVSACAVLLALLPTFVSCSDDAGPGSAGAAQKRERAVPVLVGPLAKRSFSDKIEAIGTARANESIVVAAQVTETVSRVLFEDGQVVEAGDVLVELTSREESSQLAEARAQYQEAKRQFERAQSLRAGGTASEALLDQRRTERDAARARLGELRARSRDRLIQAPFSGVLGMRGISPGTLVQPGETITTLDDIDTIKLDFSVPERFLSVLAAGQGVQSTAAAYPGRAFEGVVRAIDTRVDPTTRAVSVRADLPNADHALRPGMLLTVALEANHAERWAIPEKAIVPIGRDRFVFALAGSDRVRRISLDTGRREAGVVEVLGGLDGSETVILEGGALLREGSLVRIVEEAVVSDSVPRTPASAKPSRREDETSEAPASGAAAS